MDGRVKTVLPNGCRHRVGSLAVDPPSTQVQSFKTASMTAFSYLRHGILARSRTSPIADIANPNKYDHHPGMTHSIDFRRRALSIHKKEGLTLDKAIPRPTGTSVPRALVLPRMPSFRPCANRG